MSELTRFTFGASAPRPARPPARLRESGERWAFDGWELHCGDCFQARDCGSNQWLDVRIEYTGGGLEGWYLVGLPDHLRNRQLWNFEARRHP